MGQVVALARSSGRDHKRAAMKMSFVRSFREKSPDFSLHSLTHSRTNSAELLETPMRDNSLESADVQDLWPRGVLTLGSDVSYVAPAVPHGNQPRCRRADVNPDWWTEPDLPNSQRRIRGVQAVINDGQVRARTLCWGECPFIKQCMKEGWDEPAHVWGGLTPYERVRARESGHLPPDRDYRNAINDGSTRSKVEDRFMAGDPVESIATSLGVNQRIVRAYATEMSHRVRAQRRESEGSAWPVPPPLQNKRGQDPAQILRTMMRSLSPAADWE